MLEEENKELKDKNNKLFMELLGKEEKNTSSESEVAEKVYRYMTRELHLNVNHDEYIEWLENH